MKFKFLIVTILFSVFCVAQKATVTGLVLDKEYQDEPMAFANVTVKGTIKGTSTNENGKFTLSLDPGNYTIVIGFLGYKTLEFPITLKANEKKVINCSLEVEGVEMEMIVLETAVNKETEKALLQDQQKAVEIKQSIGAQEMSKKGLGDVAAAIVKTTGVSKQEGSGSIFVRGLGDRYNSTSMNGLPVSSNDPEKKNLNLNLFSTDIVEYISVDKVYSSRIWGDFAGGNVDINSKNHTGPAILELSAGTSANTNALEIADNFILQEGPSKFGYANYDVPDNALNSFNFKNSLNPTSHFPLNSKFGIKTGRTFNVGKTARLSFFANASFDNGYEFSEGINNNVNAQDAAIKTFNQKKYSYNTNTTGLFNTNYSFNSNHKIGFNFLYINSSSQTKDNFTGAERDYDQFNNTLLVQRNTFVENTLLINQLIGQHKLTKKINFEWGTSYNIIEGNMPDRTQNKTGILNTLGEYTLAQNQSPDNHRYYQNLVEDEIAANFVFSYKFLDNEENSKGKLSFGYNGRIKNRDFKAIQYNFRISEPQLQTVVDPNNLDNFFNNQNYNNGFFSIESFAGDNPQTYNGEQIIHAGFGNFEYNLSEKLSAVTGLRFERVQQSVSWRTQLDFSGKTNTFSRNEFLPNLLLKYSLKENQNLRFGFSKTYTLPQFKERALFVYEDVTEIKVGNPNLYPSQDYNFDLKWEMFPKSDEVFSATAFGKYILDPINETLLASATNDISYVNISDFGYVYGLETEIRKNVFSFDQEKNKLSAGLNTAIMKTYQELDVEKVSNETDLNINLTDKTSGFTGAANLILNADVSYFKEFKENSNLTTTIAYTYNSDKIYALGNEGKGNLVDKGIGTLDFVLKSNINKNLGLDFSAKNILNPKFNRVQQNQNNDITIFNYKRGVYMSLGLSYKF